MANGIQLSSEVTAIARRLGLSSEAIYYCLDVELVRQPVTELDLVELRRARRLLELEVNLEGIEIILRMRKQLCAMQAQLEAMANEMADAQRRFENQIGELERRLAQEL